MEQRYAVDGIEDGIVRLVSDEDDSILELPHTAFLPDAKVGWIVVRDETGAFTYLEAQTKERQEKIRARLARFIKR